MVILIGPRGKTVLPAVFFQEIYSAQLEVFPQQFEMLEMQSLTKNHFTDIERDKYETNCM